MLQTFEQTGFAIIENVIATDECDRLIEAINCQASDRHKAGIRNLMSNQVVANLAKDRRLTEIAAGILGRYHIPYKATLFEKTAKANWLVAWHQDTALPLEQPFCGDGWGPISIKDNIVFVHAPTKALSKVVALRIHLDASTETNGPLRVIPSSHKKRLVDEGELHGWSKLKSITCLAGKGSVIAMSPLILHASSKCLNDEPRRVLHIEYADQIELSPGIKLAIA